MAETMTGTVKTFADLQRDLNNRPEPTPEPQAATQEPASQPAPTTTPETIPATNGQVATTATEPPAPTDNSVSTFDISFGDEPQQPATTTAQPQQPTYNWKDELKKVPLEELAAELGIDPFALEMNKHIKGGGQAIDYLNAKAIDYNKISDESLLKNDLRIKNPNLSPKQVDLLYNKRYGVDELADEDTKELAEINLQTDAYQLRQAKIAEQSKFKIAENQVPQKNEAFEQWQQNMQAQAQIAEQLTNYYSNHEATKKLNESKRVTVSFDNNVPPFSWNVNQPELITKAFTDDGTIWQRITSNAQGEPDVAKQQLIALFAYNPNKYNQDLINYGMSLGQKKLMEEGQNAQKPQAIVASMPNSNAKAVPTGVARYGDKARQ